MSDNFLKAKAVLSDVNCKFTVKVNINWSCLLINRNRSAAAFEKDFAKVVNTLKMKDWTPKWSEYFCANYCDFYLSCDEELHGAGQDPTVVV